MRHTTFYLTLSSVGCSPNGLLGFGISGDERVGTVLWLGARELMRRPGVGEAVRGSDEGKSSGIETRNPGTWSAKIGAVAELDPSSHILSNCNAEENGVGWT